MTTDTDFLERIDISRECKTEEELKSAIVQARYNLTHIPDSLTEQWEFLKDISFSLSDTDAIIVTRMGIQLLLGNPVTDLYLTYNWELLAENFDLIDKTKGSDENVTELVTVRTLYKDDAHWNKSIKSGKNILSKVPPQQFIDKWPILGSEVFRTRIQQNDSDTIIVVSTAMKLSKGLNIPNVYLTDDWELLTELIRITRE